MFKNTLHTYKDPDQGVVSDGRFGAQYGNKVPEDKTVSLPFFFGGADVRKYVPKFRTLGTKK